MLTSPDILADPLSSLKWDLDFFSGFISKNLTNDEEVLVKEKLRLVLNVEEDEVMWFEKTVNPLVRSSAMKHLLALFEIFSLYRQDAERRLDKVIPLLVDNAVLPSRSLKRFRF